MPFVQGSCAKRGCLCQNWKPSFLPRLIFNWRTFLKQVTALWWRQWAKNQVSTNQNWRNRWCQIVRQTLCKSRASTTSLYNNLCLQIPCICSLPTPHTYSTSEAHLESSPTSAVELFCGISQRVKAIDYFRRRAPSWMFDRIFGRILNATLPNNLL